MAEGYTSEMHPELIVYQRYIRIKMPIKNLSLIYEIMEKNPEKYHSVNQTLKMALNDLYNKELGMVET